MQCLVEESFVGHAHVFLQFLINMNCFNLIKFPLNCRPGGRVTVDLLFSVNKT